MLWCLEKRGLHEEKEHDVGHLGPPEEPSQTFQVVV